MNFGGRTTEGESRAIIARAVERGLRHFDTANVYGNGKSERIVGLALAAVPDARLATKVGILQVRGQSEGLAPERVLQAVGESLERLRRDSVDLLYLHAPDRATPIGETLGAVSDLIAAGRIKQFGVSNYAAWEIVELTACCDTRKMARPQVSQVLHNLAVRQIEIEYAPFAAKYGIHTAIYNPLAGGLLARPAVWGDMPPKGSRFDTQARYRSRYWTERFLTFAGAVQALAIEAGLTMPDLAYGWLAQHPAVDSVIAGPGTVAHLDAAIDGCTRVLSHEVISRLRELQRTFDGTDASYAR
jgi:aryl-alcohol dehydrogenase-like predicted oxidoreductase